MYFLKKNLSVAVAKRANKQEAAAAQRYAE
jgi:hypothetical protein